MNSELQAANDSRKVLVVAHGVFGMILTQAVRTVEGKGRHLDNVEMIEIDEFLDLD